MNDCASHTTEALQDIQAVLPLSQTEVSQSSLCTTEHAIRLIAKGLTDVYSKSRKVSGAAYRLLGYEMKFHSGKLAPLIQGQSRLGSGRRV